MNQHIVCIINGYFYLFITFFLIEFLRHFAENGVDTLHVELRSTVIVIHAVLLLLHFRAGRLEFNVNSEMLS